MERLLVRQKVLYEYAQMYLERDQDGDREKADKLLNQAMKIFQKMGAKKDIEKTMRLIEALHPPPTQTHEKAVSPDKSMSTLRCRATS